MTRPDRPAAPSAPKRPAITEIHGRRLVDDYAWLRERDDAQVRAYLEAEEAHTEALTAGQAALREALYREILTHIQETDSSVPYRDGDDWFYVRTEAGRQYPIYCRRRGGLEAPEEVLLDQNTLAEGHDYFSVGLLVLTDDGRRMAYTVDDTGYRQYTLHVVDLDTREHVGAPIRRVTSAEWAADNATLFCVTEDPVTKRSDTLHRLVPDTGETSVVFHEADELFDIDVGRSRDRSMLWLESASKVTTEWRALPASRPLDAWRVLVPRSDRHEYDVSHRHGELFLRTNLNATNFRVVRAPLTDPAPERWAELVPHRPEVKIESLDLFARHAVLLVWEHGIEHLEVVDLATGRLRRVPQPDPVYSLSMGPNEVFDTPRVRFAYQSLARPTTVFDCELDTLDTTLLKETPVPGGFDRQAYLTERVWATAGDGARVPISIVSRRGSPQDGSTPLLLYAYGSYGLSIPPAFSAARLPLLDRGVRYAIAHIRGGGELGEPWREQGRMRQKLNSFTDFIACGDHLIATGYTSASRLAIQGGSAGGMLMGGVVNMRPDLCRAAIIEVPFVDVVNTMLDATLPLTTSEYIEWGNPNEREAFEYMLRYSPYDNVTRQAYPAMLVKISVFDSQVPYWEGAKFVAKLRQLNTGTHPVLLKVNFAAGHGGASGRYDAIRETAFNWAWVLSELGSPYTLQDRGTNNSSKSATA